jgi:hypothetical protein
MKYGFEVTAEAAAVTPALEDAAIRTFERVHELPERALRQGLPVPEGLFRGLGPEAGPFEPTEVGCAGSGKAVDERVPSPPRAADRELAPQGGWAPTRHCPFGCRSWRQGTAPRIGQPSHIRMPTDLSPGSSGDPGAPTGRRTANPGAR